MILVELLKRSNSKSNSELIAFLYLHRNGEKYCHSFSFILIHSHSFSFILIHSHSFSFILIHSHSFTFHSHSFFRADSLTRIIYWPEPYQCTGKEPRLAHCDLRMNGQIYGHKYGCDWEGKNFVFLHCGKENLDQGKQG